MTSLRYPLAGLACMIAFFYALWPIVRGRWRDPAFMVLCASFGCQGIYMALSTPAAWTGSLFGEVTWYNVVVQLWIVAALACQQVLLILWIHPPHRARPRIRRRIALFAAIGAAMALLFLLAGRHGPPVNHFSHPGDQPYFFVYQLIYLTTFSCSKVILGHACLRYSRLTHSRWIRHGLRIAAAGSAVDLLYPLGRFADILLVPLGWNPASWSDVSRTGLTVGITLNVIGWTAPLWGRHLADARRWCTDFRRYHRLRPLWLAIHRAHPESVLLPAARSDVCAVRDLRFQLHRRVIEIRDGCLALRQWIDPATERRLAARYAGRPRADHEAARIAAALSVTGPGGPRSPAQPPDAPSAVLTCPLGPDYVADVVWLVEVSRAFDRARRPAAGRSAR
ncbi:MULTISPECIES: MAB_1171c family putative transporter [Streptomyces]|uniref:MAB_1171c family putative transporter n=1 Tax=Streptomyces ramulosus TaxID=47762 RepID=A0ABW1FA12_9ACTN